MPDRDGQPWWAETRPSRPRAVEGGVAISSARGDVARTWWSRRFLEVLESLGVGGRLARGRTYARQGQIVSVDIGPGHVTAQVQGTRPRPYTARLGVATFGKEEWAHVTTALAADATVTAALLGGELPHEIEDVIAGAGSALFPQRRGDLTMDCTCPDVTVPCKHLAAVCYVLAERFDADPFVVLELRGRDRESLLDEVRRRRGTPQDRPSGVEPLAELLDSFFAAGSAPGLGAPPLSGPRIPSDALLDQVPAFPISVRGAPLAELLRPAYRALAGPADR